MLREIVEKSFFCRNQPSTTMVSVVLPRVLEIIAVLSHDDDNDEVVVVVEEDDFPCRNYD